MAASAAPARTSPLALTFILCALVGAIDGYDLAAMPLAVPHVVREWAILPASFSLSLAAVLIGLGAGAILLAPLGDRHGRRPAVLAATAAIALAMAGTATATSVDQFTLWRLLTGTALGVCLPNVTALVSELAPPHRRASVLTLVFCGVPIGGMAAGLVAPPLVALGGWQAIFIASAAFTLMLIPLLVIGMPESPKFLSVSRQEAVLKPRVSMLAPLGRGYRVATAVFVGLFTMNALSLYMLTSWIPTLLPQAGFSLAAGARMAAIVQVGGLVAGLLLSWFLDRASTVVTLVAGYLIVAVCLAAFSLLPPSAVGWGILLLIVGGGISGAHLALMAVGTGFYPPQMLSSAIGLAVAVARLGAIAGPLIGGWAIARAFGPEVFFLLLMLPILICAAGALLIPSAERASSG
jgi:AAHS family 4-hydroxybenzoate transporter-like MFS transporter